MKQIGLMIGFLAVLAFVLPSLPAQTAKKKTDKTDKKVAETKDDTKDPDGKDEPKKKADAKPEKLVYGAFYKAVKIRSVNVGSREITLEIPEPDPKKIYDMNVWIQQRNFDLNRQYADALRQKDFNARANQIRNWQIAKNNFAVEMAKRQTNLT